MSVSEKQLQLRQLIKKIGWSQKEFARAYYFNSQDEGDDVEAERFEEKFKKHLSRSTTPEELLDRYVEFIFMQREARNMDVVKLVHVPLNKFSENFNRRMQNISKNITSES